MQKTRKHSDPPPPLFIKGSGGFHSHRHNLRWALLKLKWRRFLVRLGGLLWQIRSFFLWLWHRLYFAVCPHKAPIHSHTEASSTTTSTRSLTKWVATYLETHPRVDSALKVLGKYSAQFVFLFTGVFSTCAAQFIFYQGAGDQKSMLLPLCNYLGMMLVGLMPESVTSSSPSSSATSSATQRVSLKKTKKKSFKKLKMEMAVHTNNHPHSTHQAQIHVDLEDRNLPSIQTLTAPEEAPEQMIEKDHSDKPWADSPMELIRRLPSDDSDHQPQDDKEKRRQLLQLQQAHEDPERADLLLPADKKSADHDDSAKDRLNFQVTPSRVSFTTSTVQLLILVSVVLDFAGCIFSNVGLAMAGSGLYQVVYSSVICWSAMMSRLILKKQVSLNEWIGIALVTFGLAFSALGESGSQRNRYVVLMGCLNTLIGAAFYGGNYVAGEYALMLPERPQPQELCLKIGTACVLIISVYQIIFVLPDWHQIITYQIDEAQGSVKHVLWALFAYTLSQLAHGLTYFVMLGSSGAVTTGIMQSLRAVCVFVISSVLYCKHQESQCFDSKRGVATMVVVAGVMYYSWAKSNAKKHPVAVSKKRNSFAEPERRRRAKSKNYIV